MKNNQNIHYFWQLLLHIQKIRNSSQQSGYAMLLTSVVSILIFSMLSVYLFSANLYKSVATATVDSGTTFYASESGLNQRAYAVRQKFEDYQTPNVPTLANPSITPAQQMEACIASNPVDKAFTADDSECRLRVLDYQEALIAAGGNQGNGFDFNEMRANKFNVKYRTYSFVRDITNYSNPVTRQVNTTTIPVGDDYAGLNTLEYRYRVYTTAAKEIADGSKIKPASAQTMLQMDFNNRLIPLFQFAIFYERDLEIANGPNFTITGPVHTNSNLYLSPNTSTLTFNGNVTTVGRIYKSLSFSTRPAGTIAFAGGTSVRSVEIVNTLMTPTDIANSTRLKANQRVLRLPPTNFLTRTGEYYEDADMRVDFDPSNDDDINRLKVRALGQNLTNGAAWSLRQPVLVRIQAHGGDNGLAETTRLCSSTTLTDKTEPINAAGAIPALPPGLVNLFLTNDQKIAVVNALQRAMVNPSSPILPYSQTQAVASGTLLANLDIELNSITVFGANKATAIAAIKAAKLNEIAALQPTVPTQNLYGACLVPAPMQTMLKRDRRENRDIKLLQSSIKSLAIWNRDGFYWDGGVWQAAANRLFPRQVGVAATALPAALPAATVPSKATSACNYDCMGIGSSDTTGGGLVWHFSVDRSKAAYSYSSGNGIVRGGNSVYGFAFTEGRRLPGALTIATDQAAYIQGDFNNPTRGDFDNSNSNPNAVPPTGIFDVALDNGFQTPTSPAREKRPASVLADTVHILSNNCSNTNRQLSCMRDSTDPTAGAAQDPAAHTVVRAGLLFKTDQPTAGQQSGQLENSLRFLENWDIDNTTNPATPTPRKTLKYRGSIVSLGVPTEYSGGWNGTYYTPPNRDWGFDSDFNASAGLPPMTPRAQYLKQKVFRRDYDTSDRSYNPVTGYSNPR
jgi:hypothetical protein